MPAFLLAFLGTGVASFISWLMKRAGYTIAVLVGFVGFFLFVLGGMVSFFYTLIASAEALAPPLLIQAASMVVPDNAYICISVTMSARVALYVWDFTINKYNMILIGPNS